MAKEHFYGSIVERTYARFEEEKNRPANHMFTYRGLFDQTFRFTDGSERVVDGYMHVLPTFEGKDLIQLVDEKIAGRKQEAAEGNKPYEKVVITDIFYGKGVFLLDCRKRWGDDVDLIGIGSDHHTKIASKIPALRTDDSTTLEYPPTHEALQKAHVTLVNGHPIAMRKRIGDNASDIIVDCYGLMYVEDYPTWEMLKKVYRTLKPEGTALLNYNISAIGRIKDISPYLEAHGYHFETGRGISFRKDHEDIRLPLKTVNMHDPMTRRIEPFEHIGK